MSASPPDDGLRVLLEEYLAPVDSSLRAGAPLDARELATTAEAVSRWAVGVALGGPSMRPPSVKQRLLATLQGAARFRPFFAALSGLVDLGPAALEAVLAKIDAPADAAWKSAPFAGVRYLDFTPGPAAGGREAGLVRVPAGATFPRHRHLGDERACVLEGSVHLDGRRFYPGDVVVAGAGTSHEFSSGPARDLVILVAHGGIQLERRARSS
jgi:quercetin dioxygenase-like cupin family protein